MIRTGIYGGSFNPIHNGHTQLADFLCKQGFLDELWFMVSPQNPLKPSAELLDENIRLQLACMATAKFPSLKVSDFEFHLPRPSFTVDTLAALRNAYPDRDFVLVIGADNWLVFDKWRQPEEILRHHHLIIYPRPGYEIDATKLPENVMLVNTPLIPISSTEIRRRIATGQDYTYFIDTAVAEEIKQNQYYLKP